MIIVSSYNKNFIPIKTFNEIDFECPLCYEKGKLEITFYQTQLETSATIQDVKQSSASCFCNACMKDIPNLKWTKELENFYTFQKNNLNLKSTVTLKKGGKTAI